MLLLDFQCFIAMLPVVSTKSVQKRDKHHSTFLLKCPPLFQFNPCFVSIFTGATSRKTFFCFCSVRGSFPQRSKVRVSLAQHLSELDKPVFMFDYLSKTQSTGMSYKKVLVKFSFKLRVFIHLKKMAPTKEPFPFQRKSSVLHLSKFFKY